MCFIFKLKKSHFSSPPMTNLFPVSRRTATGRRECFPRFAKPSVAPNASIPLPVGDLPFGTYESTTQQGVETAMALQEAECFAVVLECVPPPVAAATTSALQIPTISIGAGPFSSGQVLVYHDLLGMLQHPHYAKVTRSKFCKQYSQVGEAINKALSEYREEVTSGAFPGTAHSPYKIGVTEVEGFQQALEKLGLGDAASSAAADAAEKMGSPKEVMEDILKF